MTPTLVTQAGPLVLAKDLAPYGERTLDRFVRVRWVPRDGQGGTITRQDFIEGYEATFGGTTPPSTVDGLVTRVYERFERKLAEQVPGFTDRYERATVEGKLEYAVLTPTQANVPASEPQAGQRCMTQKMVHAA